MSKPKNYDRIESYLRNQMESSERESFEQELFSDKNLKEEVETQQIQDQVMDRLVEKDLMQDMINWDRELEQQPSPKKRFPLWLLVLPLSLFIGGIFYYNSQKNNVAPVDIQDNNTTSPSPPIISDPVIDIVPPPKNPATPPPSKTQKELPPVATNLSPKPPSGTQLALTTNKFSPSPQLLRSAGKGTHENIDNPITEVVQQFQEGDTTLALQSAQSLLDDEDWAISAQELIGTMHFYLKDYPNATKTYESLSTAPYAGVADRAEWNLLLIYLIMEPTSSEFKTLLQTIQKDSLHMFKNSADSLSLKLQAITNSK